MTDTFIESTILTPDVHKQELRASIEPLTKSDGNLTLDQFFALMFNVLEVANPELVFAPAYPQYLLPETREFSKTMENPTALFKNTITYMITREEPGSLGGNNQPFGGATRELTPRHREAIKTSDEKSRSFHGQLFDTLVQFDIWALTNWEVEQLAIWFKRFMMSYRGFFKEMGISELLFWWRGRDDVSSKLKNSLHVRSLVYFVRTEEISYEDDYNLKEVKIQISEST